jgi:hypothetical protein
MKRYTVTWVPTAENRLAELWLRAVDRASVQEAADFIDMHLAVHPHSLGMEISAGLRAARIGSLELLYRVDNLDRMVRVLAVRQWR